MSWLIGIRLHGRGGQGAVTAATILARAALSEGQWSQVIPGYGVERRGAPVKAFVRIDDKPIRLTSELMKPDCIVVLDQRLPRVIDVEEGLKKGGIMLLNDKRSPEEIRTRVKLSKVATVDATGVAVEIFGRTAIPITNTAMLGAFSAATHWVKLDSLLAFINERFSGGICEKNIKAAKTGYKRTKAKIL